MSMQRFLQLVLVGTFALVATLPGIQMLTGFPREDPLQEYRNLAELPPHFRWEGEGFKQDRKQFEEWFNDHLGFRSTLIRLLNEIVFRVFHEADLVYVGSNGWLFQKVFLDGAYSACSPRWDASYASAFQRVLDLRDLLAAKGITLVICDIPLKHSIYPEFLPPNAPRLPVPNRFELFRQFLDAHNVARVDIKSVLLEGKKTTQVCLKQDLHWSIEGSFLGAKALVAKIGELEYGRSTPWRFPFSFTEGEMSDRGSESRALPLLRNLRERWSGTEPDGIMPGPLLPLTENNPWDRIYRFQGEGLLPPTVALNDSFFEYMEHCGLAQHFVSLHTGRTIHIEPQNTGINAVLRALPPETKYFILEYMENNLDFVLPETSRLEK